MNELEWIKTARQYVGLKEIKGTQHNPTIVRWLNDMGQFSNESKAWWKDDETPWCGLFVGHVMGSSSRFVVKEWYRAKEWASPHLIKLAKPAYGCIAVMDRTGGGHVGFVIGKDSRGNIMLIGGNQGDMVSIAAFDPSRITGYFWPSKWEEGKLVKAVPHSFRYELPTLQSNGSVSVNEA